METAVDFPIGGGHEIETGAVGIASRPVEVVEKAECGAVRDSLTGGGNLDAAEIATGISRIGRGVARIKNVVGHGALLFCSALCAFADGAENAFTVGGPEIDGGDIGLLFRGERFAIREQLKEVDQIVGIDAGEAGAEIIAGFEGLALAAALSGPFRAVRFDLRPDLRHSGKGEAQGVLADGGDDLRQVEPGTVCAEFRRGGQLHGAVQAEAAVPVADALLAFLVDPEALFKRGGGCSCARLRRRCGGQR
nr:MAG TPA: hypothetical protein [Caudoviricetes sp.]